MVWVTLDEEKSDQSEVGQTSTEVNVGEPKREIHPIKIHVSVNVLMY